MYLGGLHPKVYIDMQVGLKSKAAVGDEVERHGIA